MIVPLSPRRALGSTPKGADGLLRRWWPAITEALVTALIAGVILPYVAFTARLLERGTAIGASAAFLCALILLWLVNLLLERMKLVDKSKETAASEAPPITRPPPPMSEAAANLQVASGGKAAVGGDLPAAIGPAGRRMHWRLEGDYKWKPAGEDEASR